MTRRETIKSGAMIGKSSEARPSPNCKSFPKHRKSEEKRPSERIDALLDWTLCIDLEARSRARLL